MTYRSIAFVSCVLAWLIGTAATARAAADRRTPETPYKTAHDAPLEPEEKVLTKAADHTQYRVEFNGIDGHRVPGFLYVPINKNEEKTKYPAILLQYGSGGNKKTNYIVALGEKFVARGFVVLTIDIPGKGDRKPEKANKLLFEGSFTETLGDYSRAVDYLESRADVDRNKLTYLGISWGAITGITYAAHDERIKVMVSLVGGGNFLGWLPPAAVSPEVRETMQSFDPFYHVGLFAPRPLLLVNCTKDQMIARFLSDSLHKAAGAGAKKVWLESDHIFAGIDRDKLSQDMIDFVQENLEKRDKGQAARDK